MSILCKQLDLSLNATKTQEMLFCTKRDKPESATLTVLIVNKLRFECHVDNLVTKASQRMHIVRTFCYTSTKLLSSMLFKSFIISILTYCLPILYTSIYAKDKKRLRKFFKDANRLSIENISDLDSIIDNRTKNLILNYIHDDEHFINDLLPKLPSGRYRTMKYRSSWGTDIFYAP